MASTIPRPSPPPSWGDLAFFRDLWPGLWQDLSGETHWQPPPDRIFRALDLTPRPRVRVVILGQDPYHTPGRATGLAFSFPPGDLPRDSLKNILTEVEADTGHPHPSGDLTGWAKQGVLLLNTVLTVPVGQAHGHRHLGWQMLVREILMATASDGPRAFVLWGLPAQKLCAGLPGADHLLLQAPHPSPLSAYRGFFGSRPFTAINAWLAARGQPMIDWSA